MVGTSATRAISIVVPILNEEQGVSVLLADMERLRPCWLAEVLFVDGGSSDGSITRIEQAGSPVVRAPIRQVGSGLSAAWRMGLAAATGSVIVTMDGDGVHRIEDVPRLLTAIEQGAALVIARRYGPGVSGMPGRRWSDRLASRAAAGAWSLRYQLPLRDPLHGFRARTSRLARALALALAKVDGNVWLGCEAALAVRSGAHVAEVPIVYGRRGAGAEHKQLGREGGRFIRQLLWGRL